MEKLPSFSNLIPKKSGPWPGLIYDNWSEEMKADSSEASKSTQQPPVKPQRQPTEHSMAAHTITQTKHARLFSQDSFPSFFDPTIVMGFKMPEPAASTSPHRNHHRKVSIEDFSFVKKSQGPKEWTSRDRTHSCVSALSEGFSWMDEEIVEQDVVADHHKQPGQHERTQSCVSALSDFSSWDDYDLEDAYFAQKQVPPTTVSGHTFAKYSLSTESDHTFARYTLSTSKKDESSPSRQRCVSEISLDDFSDVCD